MVRTCTLALGLLLAVGHVPKATAQQAAAGSGRSCGDASSATDASRVPCRIETSVFAAVEAPTIFSDVKVRSTDLLEASLSVENKGGSLAYAPFLYGLSSYREVASEFRLRVFQKDSLTTFGFGTQYNPLSPRGARGKRWTGGSRGASRLADWSRANGTAPPRSPAPSSPSR